MHPFAAFCRRNLNALGLELYSLAYPLLPKDRRDWLFEKNVNIVPAETGVKIIERDGESVTIGKFNKDGTYSDKPFRILTATDLHLGDTPSLRRKTMQMLANHISQAKPDLVIFTGDVILSKYQQLDSVQFARFMEKTGVYWAIVFGNHEVREEKGFYKWLMLDSVRRYPHCLALHGNDSLYGYGNYRIDIKNGENSLLQSLYLFDSGRDIRERYYKDYGVPEDMKGYDFLKPEQIEWYKNCVRSTEEKYGKVKSMMYFHIPLPEFEHVMKLDENGHYVPTGEAKIFYGGMYESVGCSPFNSGMFDAICELGSTQAVYCGHDHINDFCANYKGICFIYSQCGGYETYTMGTNFGWPEEKWMQGVTVTEILRDGSITVGRRFNRDYLKRPEQFNAEKQAYEESRKNKMASSKEYLDYVLEQLSETGDVTSRAMMGEYILYFRGKVIGGIYDNRLLVKPVKAARRMMPDASEELPYDGAKPMLSVDNIEDKEFLKDLFEAIYDELSSPKKK